MFTDLSSNSISRNVHIVNNSLFSMFNVSSFTLNDFIDSNIRDIRFVGVVVAVSAFSFGVFMEENSSLVSLLGSSGVSSGVIRFSVKVGNKGVQLRRSEFEGIFEDESEDSFLAGGSRVRSNVHVEGFVEVLSGTSINDVIKVNGLVKFEFKIGFSAPDIGLQ